MIDKQRAVRAHFRRLLGDDFFSTCIITLDQARSFSAAWSVDKGQTCPPCCTIDDFKLDLLGPLESNWNESAGRVFCRDFLDFHGLPDDATRDITSAFFTRIKTLKAKYKKTLLQQWERREIEKKNRRYRRKYLVCIIMRFRPILLTLGKLFHRRLRIAIQVPSLNKHIAMLEKLTLHAMSTDESDSSGEENTTYVIPPSWRAQQVTQWLRTFDSVSRTSGILSGPGPRLRIYNNSRVSQSTRIVPGLPVNAYDKRWLERRNDIEFTIFPSSDIYDFNHGPDVFE